MSASIGTAFALTMPANVKSVDARTSGSEIVVEWSAVPNAKSYRVYFSHESILNNGGNYDDFEQTPDATTSFVFKKAPLSSEKIYIGILAVDGGGNESEGFETEAFIEQVAATSSSASSEASTSTAVPMGIESVRAITETGVLVTFTKELHPSTALNTSYFLIATASGVALSAERIEMKGKQVLIVTAQQEPDTEYIVRLLSTIQAFDGTNATPSEPSVRLRTPSRSVPEPLPEPPPPVPTEEYGKNPNLPGGSMNRVPDDREQSPPEELPDSGLGLLGIAAISGLGAMKHVLRRKRVTV